MSRLVLSLVAITYGVVAAHMWMAPHHWYESIPGVAAMGPYNVHFVRDIALAFLVSALSLGWASWKFNRTAAVIGAAWPCLHAVFHIWIWAMMRNMALDYVALVNLLGIQTPAWLALWAGLNLFTRRQDT